ncbi:MAG: hypothetical protein ACRC26_09925, partial [Bacteroidales bacterium]
MGETVNVMEDLFFCYCLMHVIGAVLIGIVFTFFLPDFILDKSVFYLCLIFFGLSGFNLAFKDKEEFYQTEENTEVVEIFAAGISNASEGNAFVLRDRDLYRYYVGDSISGFELRKIPADISTVKYTNGKPHIKAMYNQYVKFPD